MKVLKKTIPLVFLLACTHHEKVIQLTEVTYGTGVNREIANTQNLELDKAAIRELPIVSSPEQKEKFKALVLKYLAKNKDIAEDQKSLFANNLAHYLAFLQVDLAPTLQSEVVNRLFNSSTQFAVCASFEDWACLERSPLLKQKATWRQDLSPALGEPVKLKSPLSLEFYFTNLWDQEQPDLSVTMAHTLGKKIKEDGTKSLSFALYGIDDHEKSMKPVFDAIMDQIAKGSNVRAVFDDEGIVEKGSEKQVFSYVNPSDGRPWIFDELEGGKVSKEGYVPAYVNFQYKATRLLLDRMNEKAREDHEAKGRIEWPNTGIMHNKFAVFESDRGKTVWSGTTNVAKTCMGEERNSNMAIYIKNPEIAAAFEAEFNEMHSYLEPRMEDSKRFVNINGEAPLPVGAFHGNKRPNTQRFFVDKDGNEIKVHFSPTDDGEHRAIVPMLLSAKEGDIIRISMFGGGGHETTRAMQYAAAKGADVRIVFDNLTGSGRGSWINNKLGDVDLSVNGPNPYLDLVKRKGPAGKITVFKSNWKGLNHHKTGSLSRKLKNGKFINEVIIVGSQNWTDPGNDKNDENMVSIRNAKKGVKVADAFVKHFDERLWAVASKGPKPKK